MGLGYPTLHRYDPRLTANRDSINYYRLAEGGPAVADGRWRYRFLVPMLARPIAAVAHGRVGSWDPVFLGLLVVNSAFVALSGVLLLDLAVRFGFSPPVGLVAALLLIANCLVANEHLAGMVDSAELLSLLLAAAALAKNRWGSLLVIAIVGALAKETIVPLLTLFASGWWIASTNGRQAGRSRHLIAIVGAGLGGFVAVLALHAAVDGHWTAPWSLILEEHQSGAYPHPIWSFLTDGATLLAFGLLLPLALFARKRLPRSWVAAALVSSVGAFALGLWNDAGPNANRPIFNCAGALLCLGAATVLVELATRFSRGTT